MRANVIRFVADESGTTAIEYAFAASFIMITLASLFILERGLR
jgi:Flp pilus assembly pilin Flp